MPKSIPNRLSRMMLLIICLSGALQLEAQGCSDAGLCTINSFKPSALSIVSQMDNMVKGSVGVGSADHSIFIFGGHVAYVRKLGVKWSLNTKLSFLSQGGNDISTIGMSDLFTDLSFQVSKTITFTGGVKIPFSKANKSLDGKGLPMDYQSSLGTFDIVTGVGYRTEKWQCVLAWQQPLTQNENTFFSEDWEPDTLLTSFQTTNQFERKGDVMFRVSHPLPGYGKVVITPSILALYHLSNDQYTDKTHQIQMIDGSAGLTVNANIFFNIAMQPTSLLEFVVAFPLVVREARPDGLTRGFVLNAEYTKKF